ncbi:hypothetical protein H1C71_010930 [Ictidomys tridecemlineatus]|nr:hypothetical protein H1C71_010930 [Ictidomys tridecemlineatus]
MDVGFLDIPPSDRALGHSPCSGHVDLFGYSWIPLRMFLPLSFLSLIIGVSAGTHVSEKPSLITLSVTAVMYPIFILPLCCGIFRILGHSLNVSVLVLAILFLAQEYEFLKVRVCLLTHCIPSTRHLVSLQFLKLQRYFILQERGQVVTFFMLPMALMKLWLTGNKEIKR